MEAALDLLGLGLGISGYRRCHRRCGSHGWRGRGHARELTGELLLWPPNVRPWHGVHGVHGVHRLHRLRPWMGIGALLCSWNEIDHLIMPSLHLVHPGHFWCGRHRGLARLSETKSDEHTLFESAGTSEPNLSRKAVLLTEVTEI